MRHVVCALFVFSLMMGISLSAPAQVNVLPEPNVLPAPGHDTPWPTQIGTTKSEPQQNAGGSMLQLCTTHMDSWPEQLAKSCEELLTDAIRAERQQLQADIAAKHALFRVEHIQTTLLSQRRQGSWVFWTVVAVVSIGLLAALAQFVRALRVPDAGGSVELAVSNNELRFKTTWLGALLLGMSMGFLVIYLFFVYPVRYVGG